MNAQPTSSLSPRPAKGALWFKHCYTTNVDEWGCIGLPGNQTARRILGGPDGYRRGDRVLLALTRQVDSPFAGNIFGVCTLLHLDRPTVEIVPEQLRRQAETWPNGIPVHRVWRTEPIDYAVSPGSATLAGAAQGHVGKLFKISDEPTGTSLQQWLESALQEELKVYRSAPVVAHLARSEEWVGI